jgi:hypothetical protein
MATSVLSLLQDDDNAPLPLLLSKPLLLLERALVLINEKDNVICDRDNDVRAAAEIGESILETNSKLEEQVESLQCTLEQERLEKASLLQQRESNKKQMDELWKANVILATESLFFPASTGSSLDDDNCDTDVLLQDFLRSELSSSVTPHALSRLSLFPSIVGAPAPTGDVTAAADYADYSADAARSRRRASLPVRSETSNSPQRDRRLSGTFSSVEHDGYCGDTKRDLLNFQRRLQVLP